jgi:ferredoxin
MLSLIYVSLILLLASEICYGFIFHSSIHQIAKKTSIGAGKVVIKVDGKVIESVEKTVNLRKELQKNNIDVYPFKAKITGNCGGAGICGTCAVKVLEGAENFNPASKNEQNTLRGKPADWRLSCCSRVSGPIAIKTKP